MVVLLVITEVRNGVLLLDRASVLDLPVLLDSEPLRECCFDIGPLLDETISLFALAVPLVVLVLVLSVVGFKTDSETTPSAEPSVCELVMLDIEIDLAVDEVNEPLFALVVIID